ncbi:TPA: polysaccharide pyruvyl transferase family protein [Vibrio vulnificus]|nr:polysaccharide pyruvyl transferase family protein [Vibrio vulnificus]HDY7873505.1 polysaccharide pyruvyl transferase family protein [Vibrio vulnificus]
MRVATLTLPLRNNYGGIIQAYALQKVFQSLGHETKLINNGILSSKSGMSYYLSLLKSKLITRKANLAPCLESFVNDEIELTEKINSNNDFYNGKLHCFDAYIVGSDQVWRSDYTCKLDEYALSFVPENKKKLSFAASLGNDELSLTNDEIIKFKKHLDSFDFISVRESSSIDVMRSVLAVEAYLALDPTLFITKELYSNLIEKRKSNYDTTGAVFSYLLDKDKSKIEFVNKVARLKNLNCMIFNDGVNDNIVQPMEDWLNGFKNASYIVTDSFHGVIFSIIFNKKFLAIGNVKRGLSRFQSVLGLFSIEKLLVTDIDNLDLSVLDKEPDYNHINGVIDLMTKHTLNKFTEKLG